jgi:hypothetical protein
MEELRRQAGSLGTWRKLVVGTVTATPVELKRGPAVKLVDGPHTETVDAAAWPGRLEALLDGADRVHLLSPAGDVHARRTKKGRWLVSRGRPSTTAPVALGHDHERHYPLAQDDPLFVATGLVSPEGRLRKPHADKYRQVQHYVELLRPLRVWARDEVRIVDGGAGKAYMSLALLAWARAAGKRASLTAVDVNPGVLESVDRVARGLGYDVEIVVGPILEYDGPCDLLVSLHACDTATDEAIAAGVRLGADAIVVAPCCHRELAAQIASRPRDALLRHGILRARQADLVTDALRAAALEAHGYEAEAIEFVAAEHTAKNVMIRAERRDDPAARASAAAEFRALADAWDVRPAVERLLGGVRPQ